MAKQTINIGSGELAGNGESIRSAFSKINDNFDELYTNGGGGVGVTGPQGPSGAAGPTGPSGTGGTSISTSDIAPTTPELGDLWYDTVSGRMYVYYDGGWVDANPASVGPIGPQGPAGNNGSVGPQGPQGVQGNVGAAGPQGPQGVAGSTGPSGTQGDTGPTGPQGVQGAVGPQGPQGVEGPRGVAGDPGAVGATGPQGNPGVSGPAGPRGLAGENGAVGATGPQGDPGPRGLQGDQGVSIVLLGTVTNSLSLPLSANFGEGYIAVDTGRVWFWGTASTWNDVGQIVGPKGDIGDTGPRGADGAPGAVGPTGPQGDPGQQGDPGPAGADGVDANPDAVVNGVHNITINTTGDFIPNSDNLQDLGSPTNRFRHLYVGPGSVYIGSNVITESATGGLVLPGLTKATGYYADGVDDEDDWGSNPIITGTVTVIDALRYQLLSGIGVPGPNYRPATYTVEKDGNRIDEIDVTNGGSGWTKAQADYARNNNMYATNVADAIDNFNAGDWVQIPFRVEVKAEDTEYEDIFGGSSDRLVNDDHEVVLGSDGVLSLPAEDSQSISVIESQGSIQIVANGKYWSFANDGNLTLPEGGDILDINGSSVLGGGGGGASNKLVNGNWEVVLGTNGTLTLADDIILPQAGRLVKDCGNTGTTTAMRWVNIPTNQEVELFRIYTGDPAIPGPGDLERGTISVEWQSTTTSGVSITAFNRTEGAARVQNKWIFRGDGVLQLPESGDIVDSTGSSVLGGSGGSNAYTPEDPDNWNDSTVNTVQAALDELAAKVAALQNFEIDGGNAFTPAAGELIIDGNGA